MSAAKAKKAPVNAFEQAKKSPKQSLKEATTRYVDLPVANYNEVDFAIKELTTLQKSTLRPPLEALAREQFVDTWANKHQPDANFKGRQGTAITSVECRKRSSASGLKDEEIEILNQNGVPSKNVDVYSFDPELAATNPELMQKIGEFLGTLNLPEGFVNCKNRTIVTDETLRVAAAKNDPDTIRTLLPIVTTTAFKPTALGEGDKGLKGLLGKVIEWATKAGETEVA